jgi:hypothetical protein
MISGTSLKQAANGTIRQAAVTLRPKRRTKFVPDTEAILLPVPAVSPVARQPKMRRSGPMSLKWRTDAHVGSKTAVRVSPNVLNVFHEAIGALAKSQTKEHARVAA